MAEIPENAKKVFQGKIFEVWQWEQKLFDGTFKTFEMLKRADSAAVIAVTPDKKIIITEQLQPYWKKTVIALPGGICDSGGTPQEEAARELREETGYTANAWKEWKAYCPEGKIAHTIYTFIARDAMKTGSLSLDGGEQIKTRIVSFDEFLELASDPDFRHKDIQLELVLAKYDPNKRKVLEMELFG